MEKKKGPQITDIGPPASKEVTKSIRHRFAEGETSVMPLADVLRNRDRGPLLTSDDKTSGQAAHPVGVAHSVGSGDKTQLFQTPAGLAQRAASNHPNQQKTQVVELTATQAALLSRTEPAPTKVAPAPRGATVAPAAPARAEPSQRTTLAAINRTPEPSALATQPSAKARVPSALDDVMAASVAEVVGDTTDVSNVRAKSGGASRAAGAPAAQAAPAGAHARHRVANGCIVVFSCKGGSGATMLSLNTAFHGAKNGHTACIVDLDLQMGDALAAMGLSPRFNLAQASSAVADHEPLPKNLLPAHDSGVAVLSQVGTLDDMDKLTPDAVAQLVLSVRQNYEIAVVDGVRDFSDNVLAVLDVAEKIVVVTVQEVLAVRRARWAFSIFRRIGFLPEDITVVLNRYSPSGDISLSSIQSMFEPALVVTVPSESNTVTQSLNRGVPLLDNRHPTPVARSVAQVCANAIYDDIPLDGDSGPSEDSSSKPLWRRIFKRSGDAT